MKYMLRGGQIAILIDKTESHTAFLAGIFSYKRYADRTLAAPAEL
jgi:hypothetical protein